MTSHNAPSVAYPLGHSRFHGYFLLCLWLTGFLLTLLWICESHAFDWRLYLALAAVILTGAVAYKGWKSTPVGQLTWDGQCWRWEGTGYLTGAAEQKLTVIVDFQNLLLLRLENPAYAHLWLWAERRVLPERWLDLRRAVYAPHRVVNLSNLSNLLNKPLKIACKHRSQYRLWHDQALIYLLILRPNHDA